MGTALERGRDFLLPSRYDVLEWVNPEYAAGGSSCGESTAAKRPSSECRLPHEYGDGSTSLDRSVSMGAGRGSLSSFRKVASGGEEEYW